MSDAQSKTDEQQSQPDNKEEQSEADSDFDQGSINEESDSALNEESDVDQMGAQDNNIGETNQNDDASEAEDMKQARLD